MEIFFAIFIPVVVLLVWYMMDRKSFTTTFLGKKKPVEPQETQKSTEVVRQPPSYPSGTYEDIGYINEPFQPPIAKVPRHEIIKHDYYQAYGNERWPRWTCKCGDTGYAITTPYESLESTEQEARRDGQDHVRKATIIDDRLDKTNGKFAF